ncbi:MAG: phosphatase PAP2 family protein [Steroidobacteraceae bacterium]
MPGAPTSSLGVWFARVDAAEYRLCRRLNHGVTFPVARRIFQTASRLGDGIVWYALIVALPCVYGRQALRPAVVMAFTSVLGLLVYKVLKRAFVRERPFITHAAIDPAMAPLDRYSFPSGHTLHAVSFALQASLHFPQLAWVLIPLALTIAASRVVLGLHYPTDVLAGAVLGASLGALGLSLS